MTDRHTVDTINDDALDQLYDDLKMVTARACRDSEDLVRTEAERDGAYRERAHLVALLAAMTDGAVIAPASDVDEPGWQIAYLRLGGWQASWHIAPRDAELFARVERVEPDDPRAQWDGHTTDQKYTRIRQHTRVLQLRGQEPYDRCLCPPTQAGLELCARCPGHDRPAPVSSGPAVTQATVTTPLVDRPFRSHRQTPGMAAAQAAESVQQTDADPDDPPVQCWHTEPDTPCDWDVCKQPERLAVGDYGTDPREQH